jgi:hypothetical protein
MAAVLAMAAVPCLAQGKARRPGASAPKSPTPVAGAPSANSPQLATADALGYVVIPDLEALLAHAEATGNAVAPTAMPPGAPGSSLAQLPGLEGLLAKPILLVLLKGQGPMAPPRPVLFLPVKDAKTYETTITNLGWKSRRAPGLLIAASTPDGLAASAKLEPEYKRLAGAVIGHDLRIFLEIGRLMDDYGPMMQMGMDAAMAPKASPDPAKKDALSPGAAKMLKVEAKAFVALLGQLDNVQWDLDLQGEGLLSDTVFAAKPGTALDALAHMPPAGTNRATALLSGSGFMTAAYQLDAPRLSSFLDAVLKESAADPAGAELLTADVLGLVEQAATTYGGQAAYRMAGSGGHLSVEAAVEVTDEAKAMAMVEKGLLLFAPGGAWASLLEDTKMTMALQKNARRHAGVAVHRLKVKAGAKPLTAEQKAAQAPFLRDTEFAVTHGYYLSAQDAAGLDALIDRAAAAAPGQGLTLRSAEAFGEGRHGYVDYDLVGLMKAVSAMTPAVKGQPNPFAALPDSAEPMLAAMTLADGRIRWQAKLPLRSFALMSETAKKATPSPAPGKTPPPERRP